MGDAERRAVLAEALRPFVKLNLYGWADRDEFEGMTADEMRAVLQEEHLTAAVDAVLATERMNDPDAWTVDLGRYDRGVAEERAAALKSDVAERVTGAPPPPEPPRRTFMDAVWADIDNYATEQLPPPEPPADEGCAQLWEGGEVCGKNRGWHNHRTHPFVAPSVTRGDETPTAETPPAPSERCAQCGCRSNMLFHEPPFGPGSGHRFAPPNDPGTTT